jgi:hypothetical protein
MSTLDSVINGDWTDRTALAASLRKLGSGNYAIAFTSDKWDLSKSDEDLAEDARKRKQAEADKQKQAHLDEYEDYSYSKFDAWWRAQRLLEHMLCDIRVIHTHHYVLDYLYHMFDNTIRDLHDRLPSSYHQVSGNYDGTFIEIIVT